MESKDRLPLDVAALKMIDLARARHGEIKPCAGRDKFDRRSFTTMPKSTLLQLWYLDSANNTHVVDELEIYSGRNHYTKNP